MTLESRLKAARWVLIAVAILTASSCSKILPPLRIPNARPAVTITSAPIDANQRCEPDAARSCYSITVNWVGYDPDGRVDRYLFAIDPPTTPHADTAWQETRANEERLLFRSTTRIEDSDPSKPLARDFHEFVIKAVDNTGAAGPPVSRSFFSYTEAPSVQITSPQPGDFSFPKLTSSVRFTWTGQDNDGVFNSRPVQYKFLLLTPSSAKNGVSLHPDSVAIDPDRLRRLFAPGFAGWDSSAGDTTTAQYTNLPPNQTYAFAVVAIDEAGAYTPTFSPRTNFLRFHVRLGSTAGPEITVFNEFFNYTWSPGWCPCFQRIVRIEVPAGQGIRFNWTAVATDGADIRYYRWTMDNPDLADDTPRSNEHDDVTRWSSPSLNLTSVLLDPFPGSASADSSETHLFYVEAADNVGLKSLAIIQFKVVRARFDDPDRQGSVLVVKDTRLQPDAADRSNPGCVGRPLGNWPTQAELDTFLFARGSAPWKCYPKGTRSRPGIFAAYDVDTLGTWRHEPAVLLSTLSRYAHVVWIVDFDGANIGEGGRGDPMTALRTMSGPDRFNTFAAYIRMGGKAWLLGGGGGFATNIDWNSTANDQPRQAFSSVSQIKDLGPGRFMYDIAHWQSEFAVAGTQGVTVERYLGRYRDRPDPAADHWSRSAAELPSRMAYRQRGGEDSLPPLRRDGQYYRTDTRLEFLQVENFVQENTSTDPSPPNLVSTLDTLFRASGLGLPHSSENLDNVVMTYYRGSAVPQGFVFSGFNVWDFRRRDAQGLVDFVLGRIWRVPAATPLARR